MRKRFLPLLVIVIAFVFSAATKKTDGPDKYAATITANDLRKHLTVLASDEYEGRETGERGQKMAAEYISGFFKSTGIPSQKDGTWYQKVNLVKVSADTSSIVVADINNPGNTSFLCRQCYYYASSTPGVNINVDDLVFAGYGIDDPKYSDYSDHDSSFYAGKILIVLDGEPSNNGIYTISGDATSGKWTKQRRAKIDAAKAHHAKALIVFLPDFEKSKESAQHIINGYSLIADEPTVSSETPLPVLYMNEKGVNTILANSDNVKQTVGDLRSAIDISGKPMSLLVHTAISISIKRKEEKVSSENVLGYVEGSDLKNEVVVVTAHYDHLGIRDSMVFNGADDDGSGTVSVMELAEAFVQAKKDGHGPRRSMLFMTVTGEEKGLLGSSWYVRHPVYPLSSTMCDLNIDMIGRVDNDHSNDSNYVYVIGSDKISPDLKKSIEAQNKKHTHLKLDYRYDAEDDPNNFYYRSDHYNFAKNDIPVAFFFNGTHADYHKETDEVSKINFSLMEKRARLVFYTAWDMANRKKPLAKKLAKK